MEIIAVLNKLINQCLKRDEILFNRFDEHVKRGNNTVADIYRSRSYFYVNLIRKIGEQRDQEYYWSTL